jgi:parallel beta-helix repeat protein
MTTLSASAATYYVDFDGGKDSNAGTTPATAFQHAPGDSAATDKAKDIKLVPGDAVIFKGGVKYRGTINVTSSGVAGQPITFDGNTAGSFGAGRATIEGSQPVGGWRRFASAEEALGHSNWQNLVYTDEIPAKADALTIHLTQGDRLLHIAQSPAPSPDLFWWDNLATARVAPAPPEIDATVRVEPKDGRKVTGGYQWQNLIDGTKNPTYLNPAKNAELIVMLPDAVTAERFAFSYGIDEARITKLTLLGDGKEILSREITADENAGKQVELKPDQPATFKTLSIRIDALDGGPKKLPSIRIAEFQALDAAGKNVFAGAKPAVSTLTDPEFFTQTDANAWAGAVVGILGKPMRFYFAPVQAYEPAEHRIRFKMLTAEWYTAAPGTKYVVLNAPHTLTQAGQYVVWRGADGQAKPRLIAWPLDAASFERDAQIGARADGFIINGANHVTVKGFAIRGQSGHAHAVRSEGTTSHLTIEGNQIRHLRSSLADRNSAISLSQTSDFTITGNEISENVRSMGVMVTKSQRGVFANNTLKRNGDTQVDFYTCRDVKVTGNVINEANGHHSNGLTFYLDNQNILVENNRVTCHRPITFHSIEGITIRNNVLDAEGQGNCISIWANAKGSNKITIEQNTMVNAQKDSFQAGIFRGDAKSLNVVIRNNIIDGLGGTWGDGVTLTGNVFLRTGKGVTAEQLGEGGVLAEDPEKIFVDAAKGDYRVKADGPATGKGAEPPR